ncbi:MAG: ATP-binding protein [Armatimonadota bacterium]|nr:ATP-binding protein [Armatimonadota bacterium]MDR7468547.1 ATP-binding protein [Armatimonadota bacterium]MDR7539649.1 ATP-binding protein [Armatimonadota bacterium]
MDRAAFVTAVVASVFVTRRILAIIHLMRQASARIAGGQYSERVPITSGDELGQLATQFNRMAETLERVEQARRDLIADIAHELRTPLASIAGYLEAMMDGVICPEPETLNRVRRDAARLQRLVDDLQELSRVEARQLPLQPRPIDVRELVETTAGRIRPQFDAKGVELRIATAAGLPRAVADPDRRVQVLTNLLGNALQYTPTGGRVEVRAGPAHGMVTIAVADTGIGIAQEHLPHVFDRFYRADRSRTRASGGSGIGLTIVKHLVVYQRPKAGATAMDLHDWSRERSYFLGLEPKVEGSVTDVERKGKDPVMIMLAAGKSATIKFIPKKTGTFEIGCFMPGHYEAGMKAALGVR